MAVAGSGFDTHYERVKLLGEGAFGCCYLVKSRQDARARYVAKEVKIGHLNHKQRMAAVAEAETLRKMNHPNVIAYENTFSEGSRIIIIMEYADGGDLAEKIKMRRDSAKPHLFSEREVMFVFVQMGMALMHVHSRKILHRDLKPMNVFLTRQGNVKLGDFGVAAILDSTLAGAQTMIGTPFYLSPEICNSEQYGVKSDIWSLGVIMYEYAKLRVPFHAHALPAVALKICNQDPEPLPDAFPRAFHSLVFSLLEKEPGKRPMLRDIFGLPYVMYWTQENSEHCRANGAGGFELNDASKPPANLLSPPSSPNIRNLRPTASSPNLRVKGDLGVVPIGAPTMVAGLPRKRDLPPWEAYDDDPRDRRRDLRSQGLPPDRGGGGNHGGDDMHDFAQLNAEARQRRLEAEEQEIFERYRKAMMMDFLERKERADAYRRRYEEGQELESGPQRRKHAHWGRQERLNPEDYDNRWDVRQKAREDQLARDAARQEELIEAMRLNESHRLEAARHRAVRQEALAMEGAQLLGNIEAQVVAKQAAKTGFMGRSGEVEEQMKREVQRCLVAAEEKAGAGGSYAPDAQGVNGAAAVGVLDFSDEFKKECRRRRIIAHFARLDAEENVSDEEGPPLTKAELRKQREAVRQSVREQILAARKAAGGGRRRDNDATMRKEDADATMLKGGLEQPRVSEGAGVARGSPALWMRPGIQLPQSPPPEPEPVLGNPNDPCNKAMTMSMNINPEQLKRIFEEQDASEKAQKEASFDRTDRTVKPADGCLNMSQTIDTSAGKSDVAHALVEALGP